KLRRLTCQRIASCHCGTLMFPPLTCNAAEVDPHFAYRKRGKSGVVRCVDSSVNIPNLKELCLTSTARRIMLFPAPRGERTGHQGSEGCNSLAQRPQLAAQRLCSPNELIGRPLPQGLPPFGPSPTEVQLICRALQAASSMYSLVSRAPFQHAVLVVFRGLQ